MVDDTPQNKKNTGKNQKNSVAPYETAGAEQLAKQPNSLPDKSKPQTNAYNPWKKEKSLLEQTVTSVWQWRNSWWYLNWVNLSIYLQPKRSIWLTQNSGGIPSPNNMQRGRQINGSILNSTATLSLGICSAGLTSGLASPSKDWLNITVSADISLNDEGKAWIDEVKKRTYTILANSNFYKAFAQMNEDLVAYGTAPTIVYEDVKDVIRLYNPALGEYGLTVDATGRHDGLYRRFVMTTSQIVGFFKLENCPKEIKQTWAQKGGLTNQEYSVVHAIEPNYNTPACPKIPGGYTWREVYWIWGLSSDYPLSKKGFMEQPFVAAGWTFQSNDPYARGPGMDILPDVLQLQTMTARLAEAIEKQVRPPLVADLSLKNQPSSALPGQVTFVDMKGGNVGMKSMYDVTPDIRGMVELIKETEQRIQKGMFVDIWLMLNEQPRDRQTAYETAARLAEKLQRLGPVVENIITDLRAIMKRIFGICMRKGMYPPIPDSLKGVNIDIEFISMLVLAQKGANTGGIERLLAFAGNMAAVHPEALDVINFDQSLKIMSEMLDNPQSLLNDDKVIAQLRQGRQQQQAAQQKMQNQQHVAQTAQVGAEAASTLASTDVGSGQSALTALLTGGGAAQ